MTDTQEKGRYDKEKYDEMWNTGAFNWNENRYGDLNPQRIWNVFIQPAIETAIKEERERIAGEVEELKKHPQVAIGDADPVGVLNDILSIINRPQ